MTLSENMIWICPMPGLGNFSSLGKNTFSSFFSNSSVQSLIHIRLFVTPWTAAHRASLSITNSQSLLILWCPLFHLPSIFASIRVFFNESVVHIKWPKYWRFSFIISPSSEYSELISFRIDWLDLLAVQGTLKSSPTTTVQKNHFFNTQLSLWSNTHIHTWLLEKL